MTNRGDADCHDGLHMPDPWLAVFGLVPIIALILGILASATLSGYGKTIQLATVFAVSCLGTYLATFAYTKHLRLHARKHNQPLHVLDEELGKVVLSRVYLVLGTAFLVVVAVTTYIG